MQNKVKRGLLVLVPVALVLGGAAPAFADTTTTVDYGTLFSGVQDSVINAITATLPLAVPILGVMLAVGAGVKVFRKLSGR